MIPTIYHFERSPFCIAIIQALRTGAVEPRLLEVPSTDRTEIITLTGGAYYQVPVLQAGDRLVYESGSDSQDVAGYLDEHYLNGRLFPARLQGLQTIVLRYLEHDVESVTFKVGDVAYLPTIPDVVERTMLIRHKERKFGFGCVEHWARERESMMAQAVELLRPFELMLTHGGFPFLFGEMPVYVDFLLYGILASYTFQDLTPFPASLPALKAWNQRVRAFKYEATTLHG